MSQVAWPSLSIVTAIVVVVIVVLARRGGIARPAAPGGLLAALRVVSSAAAFFVPAAMVAVLVGVASTSMRKYGENPWASLGNDTLPVTIGTMAAVAAGIAGHIGLLDASRHGRAVDSSAFMTGIRSHTITMIVAKLVLGGAVVGSTRLLSSVHIADRSIADLLLWVALIVPCLLLAPVVGTATRHPGRPLRAIGAAIATAIARPWAVASVLAAQAGVFAIGIAALTENVTSNDQLVFGITRFHASSLSFDLFPFIYYARFGDGLGIAIPLIAVSPVFLTAYWMVAAAEPESSQAEAVARRS